MENTKQANNFQTRKKIPPRKPPRLSIKRKPGSNPAENKEQDEHSKEGVGSPFINKNVIGNNSGSAQPKCEERTGKEEDYEEVFDAIMNKDKTRQRKVWREHVYESISDRIASTKSTSCQTDACSVELEYYFNKHGGFKIFKETSCQTDSLPETLVFKRSKNQDEIMAEEISKTEDCDRLSSGSSNSTRDSVDSGHFSVHPDRSPTSPNDDDIYLWQPEGLSQEKVKSFMDCLPSDKIPKAGTPEGVAYFKAQLVYQNPEQDVHPELCKSLTTKDQAMALKDFWMECVKSRGTGFIQLAENSKIECQSCGKFFNENDVTVVACDGPRHPSCFSCTVCHELLVKLIYYNNGNNRLYCGRHFAERFKPRCFECDELVVCGKITKAMGHTWHADHFCCVKCGKKITENKYTTTDEDRPMCLNCHTKHLAEVCYGCSKKITIGQKKLTYDNKHWHESCFVCEKCNDSLSIGRFRVKDDKIVCFKCCQNEKSKLCYRCGDEIKAGTRLFEHEGNSYHDACFSCEFCNQRIHSGFMENEGCFYCPECYHRLFSEKCTQCGLPITGDGVTYNNEMWHNSCFDCFYCHKPISSQKFLIRYDNRYCGGCYEKMFAKECHSCHEMIKDSAYLTNDDMFWHNHCFRCAGCEKDLKNVGFHMVDKNIYCAQCPED